jgi:hypothetical protein
VCNGDGGQGWYRTAEQQPEIGFREGYAVGQSVNSSSRYKALFHLGRNGAGLSGRRLCRNALRKKAVSRLRDSLKQETSRA